MKGFLTAGDLAQRLGVARVTARRWCQLGLFPNAEQVARSGTGGVWLVPEADLATFARPKVERPAKPRPARPAGAGGEDPWAGLEVWPWELAEERAPRPRR